MSGDFESRASRTRWPIEKAAAYALAVAPALWLAGLAYDGDLGVRVVHEAVKESGDWALRLFWLTLLVSPARRILSMPRLIGARRILGLGTFGLTVAHVGLYALDLEFDWTQIGLEIVLRFYLTIGAVATIGLVALAATSSDRMIARLGSTRWNRLHGWVHLIAALSVLHFLLRSRTDPFEPVLMIGLLAWLVGYRLIQRIARDVGVARLFALAFAAAAFTAFAETAWHAAETGIDPGRVFAANFTLDYGLRPAAWVLLAGIAAALAGWRRRVVPQRPSMRISASHATSGSTRGQSAS